MRKAVLIILSVVLMASVVHAESAIRLDVKEKVLGNGMRILVLENHTAPVVACFLSLLLDFLTRLKYVAPY